MMTLNLPPIACEDDEVVRSGCGNLNVAANVEREMVSVHQGLPAMLHVYSVPWWDPQPPGADSSGR